MAYIGFDKLAGKLAGKYGPARAKAIAASIGNKKYGKGAMEAHAKSGTSMQKVKPKAKKKVRLADTDRDGK